jgi:hypothetical protein
MLLAAALTYDSFSATFNLVSRDWLMVPLAFGAFSVAMSFDLSALARLRAVRREIPLPPAEHMQDE